MAPSARLQIATDHAGYFEHIRTVLEGSSLAVVPFGPTAAAAADEVVGSNFERKYRVQGRALYSIAARKRRPITLATFNRLRWSSVSWSMRPRMRL